MAFLRKRGKVWYVYWYERGKLRGLAVSKWKVLAERKLREIEYSSDVKKHFEDEGLEEIDFLSFSKEYLESLKENKAPRSYKRDLLSASHFAEYFGALKLYNITQEAIEDYKRQRLKKSDRKHSE